jgi:biotin synthase-like enzyme
MFLNDTRVLFFMTYDSSVFVHVDQIALSETTQALLDQASKVFHDNFDGKTWYGRCIFLSWYCSLGDCAFCFRSTTSHKIRFKESAKRSLASVALEALLCRELGWRIEFLTGGYGMMSFEEIITYAKIVHEVYGEKIWLNIGALSPAQLDLLAPYIKGVCASVETATPQLHDAVCPRKPLAMYDAMLSMLATSYPQLKRSIAVIVGMGPAMNMVDDFTYLEAFVRKHKLDRITVYALKPVKGTPFSTPPTTEEYVTWLAKLRIAFPKLQIIAGTNLRRCEEAGYLMQAGANAITKFPATKQFATNKAKLVHELIQNQKRIFTSNLLSLPAIDWTQKILALSVSQEIKDEMLKRIGSYVHTLTHPVDKDESMCFE